MYEKVNILTSHYTGIQIHKGNSRWFVPTLDMSHKQPEERKKRKEMKALRVSHVRMDCIRRSTFPLLFTTGTQCHNSALRSHTWSLQPLCTVISFHIISLCLNGRCLCRGFVAYRAGKKGLSCCQNSSCCKWQREGVYGWWFTKVTALIAFQLAQFTHHRGQREGEGDRLSCWK